MERVPENRSGAVFRPMLKGCIARDLRMAQMVEESRQVLLCTVAAHSYRGLLLAERFPEAARMFEELVDGEIELYRLLGELALVLGGNPVPNVQIRMRAADLSPCAAERNVSRFLREALYEKKSLIDRFQTMMGRTGDRVLRSVLAHLLTALHEQAESISRLSV